MTEIRANPAHNRPFDAVVARLANELPNMQIFAPLRAPIPASLNR